MHSATSIRATTGRNAGARPAAYAVAVARTRILVDTCVLYPPSVRDLVLRLAAEDVFQIRVSTGVLDELEVVLKREAGLAPDVATAKVGAIRRAADALGALTPAICADRTVGDTLALPDPDDGHLVDAALESDCDAILTFNLRHLPEAELERVGLEAWHPDLVLEELAKRRHAGLLRVVADLVSAIDCYEQVSDVAIKIHTAGLPTTGEAMLRSAFAAAVAASAGPAQLQA